MTENSPKSPARLLIEAWQIVRWQGGHEAWPDEFQPEELAALMAGCQRKEDKRRYTTEAALISAGIKSRALAIRAEETKRTIPGHEIDTGERFNFGGLTARQIAITSATEKITRRQFIDRRACAAWLRAIGESNPSEYVRAWLGAEWKESNAEAAAPQPGRETRKKDAMIRELEAEWPSIVRDLTDASRNGLSAAAKAQKHGHWYISSAREWAKQEGKLRAGDGSTAIQSASLAGQLKAATKIHRAK